MARRSTLLPETQIVTLPDGFVPGTVAPFVMRYGTDFLVAMQRAASVHDAAQSAETEMETA
ncbi:hypothetical protein [Xanthomonas sp. NCPPB 2632]|jgi:hypothetical protein|uniref:hypothetical protein n=1 Tax=Xanthomonas sp. NCPPB 2632 TaxID=3240912 RepID=UPI003519816B